MKRKNGRYVDGTTMSNARLDASVGNFGALSSAVREAWKISTEIVRCTYARTVETLTR